MFKKRHVIQEGIISTKNCNIIKQKKAEMEQEQLTIKYPFKYFESTKDSH